MHISKGESISIKIIEQQQRITWSLSFTKNDLVRETASDRSRGAPWKLILIVKSGDNFRALEPVCRDFGIGQRLCAVGVSTSRRNAVFRMRS
jgi:hypothetical protein